MVELCNANRWKFSYNSNLGLTLFLSEINPQLNALFSGLSLYVSYDLLFISAIFLAAMMLVKPDIIEGRMGVILYILQVRQNTSNS